MILWLRMEGVTMWVVLMLYTHDTMVEDGGWDVTMWVVLMLFLMEGVEQKPVIEYWLLIPESC